MSGAGGGTFLKPPQRAARGSLWYFDAKFGWRPTGSGLTYDGTILNAAGVVTISNSTASAASGVGALVVTGGVWVGNQLFVERASSANSFGSGFITGDAQSRLNIRIDGLYTMGDGTSKDVGFCRNAAGVLEINSSTPGTLRDLTLRNLTSSTTIAGAAMTLSSTLGVSGTSTLDALVTQTNTANYRTQIRTTASGNAGNDAGFELYAKNASGTDTVFGFIIASSSTITAGAETTTFTIGLKEAGVNYSALQFIGRSASFVQDLTIGGALKLGNAYVAGAPGAATGTITIKDSTGTVYRIPVLV